MRRITLPLKLCKAQVLSLQRCVRRNQFRLFSVGSAVPSQSSDNISAVSGQQDVFEDPRHMILDAALRFVTVEGWSKEALAAGAIAVGYPAVSQGMFSRGPVDLAYHVMNKANQHMAKLLSEMDLAAIPVNERVKAGVKSRLLYMAPYLKTWPQAMALGASPQNVAETVKILGIMADEIWYQAGDRSTDLNWYTRRVLLMGVYIATETFMLTDRSPDFVDTWEFLDRRLTDVATFGRQVGEGLALTTAVAGGVGSLVTAGFDMVRPFALVPGQHLPEIATRATAALQHVAASVAPSRGPGVSAADGSAQPKSGNFDLLQGVVAVSTPIVTAASGVLNQIGRSAQAAGITLPQPPPLLAAFLSMTSGPAGAAPRSNAQDFAPPVTPPYVPPTNDRMS